VHAGLNARKFTGEVRAVQASACRWFPTFSKTNRKTPKPEPVPSKPTPAANSSAFCARRRRPVRRRCRAPRSGPIRVC